MSNRNFTLPSFTLEKRVINLFADVDFSAPTAPVFAAAPAPANAFGSTNSTANVTHKGVLSVTRNSTGVLTFVFGSLNGTANSLDTYVKLLDCSVRFDNSADGYVPAQSLQMYVSGNHVNVQGTSSLQVTFVNGSGTPTDPDDTAHHTIGHFRFTFGDSTAT